MEGTGSGRQKIHVNRESLNQALAADLMGWSVSETNQVPLLARVTAHRLNDIRLLEISGNPYGASRGHSEISADGEACIGVLYQKSGSTWCRTGGDRLVVGPGEISIWHSRQPATFEMPEQFDKLCMAIPVSRFDGLLRNVEEYAGLHFPASSNLAVLLGSYLSALTDKIVSRDDETAFDTVDVTLELLGAAFRAKQRSAGIAPRDRLFLRIARYIENRLQDRDLSPQKIADDNGVSVRYLYLLFSQEGMTVAGWVRKRRLERCRLDLDATSSRLTVTDIAHRWGFNDSAHFSRLFKVSFGIAPTAYRRSRLNAKGANSPGSAIPELA